MVSIVRHPRRRMGWLLKIITILMILGFCSMAYLTQVADRGLLLSSGHELQGSMKTRYMDFMRTFKISRIVAEEGKYSLPGIRIYKKGLFWARSIKGEIPRNLGFVILREGDKLTLKTNKPVNEITMRYMGRMLSKIQIEMTQIPKVQNSQKINPTVKKDSTPKNNGFSLFNQK